MSWAADFWDTLTGQKQETERTRETNEANAAAAQAANEANLQIARETNETNKGIAEQNLGFQRENLEYQKALQQEIFNREDTAYQRTKADMLAAGLNPLSMQSTNGAGEAIATSPLNNNFQAQQSAPMQAPTYQKAQTMMSPIQALSSFSSILGTVVNSVESIKTGTLNRDNIRQQMQHAQANFIMDNIGRGIFIGDDGKPQFDENIFNKYIESKSKEHDYNIHRMEHDIREWNHLKDIGRYDSDSDIEKMLTAVSDWLTNGRAKEQWDKLTDTFPLLKLVDKWAQSLMSKPETIIQHGGKKYKENSNGDWIEIN